MGAIADPYREKLEARLREYEAEIEKLKAKADRAKADIRIEYYRDIEGLRARHGSARQKLDELARVGRAAGADLKVGIDNALEELRKGLENALAKFK